MELHLGQWQGDAWSCTLDSGKEMHGVALRTVTRRCMELHLGQWQGDAWSCT